MAKRSTRSAPPRQRSKQNRPRRHFRWGRFVTWTLLCCVLLAVAVCGIYWWRASRIDLSGVNRMKERSTVYDMDGNMWGRLQGENRVLVKQDEVSPFFIACLLAREDTRFFEHGGVDPKGIIRAVVRTAQGQQQGGSTLTQQLARNSFTALGQRKSIDRKLLELFVALRIESAYTKEEILIHYMNRIYFGSGVYGIEMASNAYFGKPARALTLNEAAMMAGIIRAPAKASPLTNLKRATAERDMVLDRMQAADCAEIRARYGITDAMLAAERKLPLKLASRKRVSTQENYAMDMVMRELDDLIEERQQDEGGMRIYTTIDPALQAGAQGALDRALTNVEKRAGYRHPKKSDFTNEARAAELPTDYLQGSVVVVDNRSGGIRALVGGRDYRESKFNRAIDAKRTVGSTFKPFVYAAAFERGLSTWSKISDGPIQPGEIDGAQGWHPGNSDDQFGGMLPVGDGLILSRNTMTVRVGNHAGIDRVARLAEMAGLGKIAMNPQSYIGNFGATPKDMTTAFMVFANGGLKRQSYLIERIDDADGEVIYRAAHASHRAMDAAAARTTSSVLAEVFERGTAVRAKAMGWSKPAAGKTGTTDDYHDAWFVGYSTSLTCGVWVGLDKPDTIAPRGYGATLALPVWVEVMSKASGKKYPPGAIGNNASVQVPRPAAKDDADGGLRKTEPKSEGGLLKPFRKFFSD